MKTPTINRARRDFLSRSSRLLAAAASAGFPFTADGAVASQRDGDAAWPDLLCSWEDDTVHYVGIRSPSQEPHGVALPARAHGVLIDPSNANCAVAVARRPGDFLVRFNVREPADVRFESADQGRVFNGHAAFSPDGRTLYTTENRTSDGAGVVGIRDAATLRKRNEFPTHGIGPHALLVERDGSVLVANGGILTLPETGRLKLNAERLDSSLVRLDANDGRLLGQWRLDDPHLSIRHLSRSTDGSCLGIALQAEHAARERRERAPVLALFDGTSLHVAQAPDRMLGGYGGDIASFRLHDRACFAVSCPHADLVAWWDQAGQYVDTVALPNACALAQNGDQVIAAGEAGELACIREGRGALLVANATPQKWDNHLVILAATKR